MSTLVRSSIYFQVSQSSGQQSNPVTLISQPAVQLVHQAISQSGMTGGAAQSVTLQQLQQHLQNQASSLAAQQPVLVCTQDGGPTKQQIDLSSGIPPGSDITLCNFGKHNDIHYNVA